MNKNTITVCATCNGTDIIKTFTNSNNIQNWLERTGYELVYIEIHKRAD